MSVPHAILAAALAPATAAVYIIGGTVTMTGNAHWRGKDHCVTRERWASGVGWVEGQVCATHGAYSWWNDSFLNLDNNENVQTYVGVTASAFRYDAATGNWVALRPSRAAVDVTDTTNGHRDRITASCGWVRRCPLHSLLAQANGIFSWHVVFKDCNAYPFEGAVHASLAIRGVGWVFRDFSLSVPKVPLTVCSP